MFECFLPDFYFEKFDDVTPDFLREQNISCLLCDVDNTLAPYEEPVPNARVRAWISLMRENGIKVVLVSNNHADRIELFNRELGLAAYPDCHKPSGKRLRAIAEAEGVSLSQTAAFGDQIFTDVWGGKMIGIRAVLVPPIKDKKTLFFRAKRLLEKPFLKRFFKEQARKGAK